MPCVFAADKKNESGNVLTPSPLSSAALRPRWGEAFSITLVVLHCTLTGRPVNKPEVHLPRMNADTRSEQPKDRAGSHDICLHGAPPGV